MVRLLVSQLSHSHDLKIYLRTRYVGARNRRRNYLVLLRLKVEFLSNIILTNLNDNVLKYVHMHEHIISIFCGNRGKAMGSIRLIVSGADEQTLQLRYSRSHT